MGSNYDKTQFKFESMKDQVETNISSFIKNETTEYFKNVENSNLPIKINEITCKVLLNLQNWMKEDMPENYKQFVISAINEEKWSEIIEAFKQEIVFGTSGIRGKLTVSLDDDIINNDLQSLNEYGFDSTVLRGSNSINEITIMKNICGLVNYMNKMKMSKIIIGYDSRVSSKLYSRLIASIFLKNGFSVILFDENNTLPELSFAVTFFDADMGIEITASHNDKRYNGYKLIIKSGSPPSADIREEITREIFNNKQKIPYDLLLSENQSKIFNSNSKQLLLIKKSQFDNSLTYSYDKLQTQYLDQIINLLFNKELIQQYSSQLSIGYSALHGTGYNSASKLFQKLGVNNVKYIQKMIYPDPLFSLFDSKQILDPSDNDTANVVMDSFINQYDQHTFNQLDILCYTDPDADRLGMIVKVPDKEISIYGKWKLLKANDVWTLFLWYVLEFFKKNNGARFFNNLFIVKNFVTSDSLLNVSKKYNVECIEGKVGFSDLTDLVRKKWKENKINIGMFEESCGFGIAGSPNMSSLRHIFEKDGMLSLAFIVEILSYTKSQKKSLLELLDEIYLDDNIGFFATYRKELPTHGIFEGIKGEFQLEQFLKNVEIFCLKAEQKIIDNNPIMIHNLPILRIKKYSTGRYDTKFWKDFPDEGIRFFLDSEMNHITIRSSGTEPKIRIFIQYKIQNLVSNNIIEKKSEAKNLVVKICDDFEKLIILNK